MRVISGRNHGLGFLLAVATFLFATAPAFGQLAPVFDHDSSRFPLTGNHRRVDCENCHLGGQFVGTPRRCDICHSGTSGRAETRPSSDHIPIRTRCNDCHTTRRWEPARMDHSSVGDECVVCHLGRTATSKPANHIQSSNDCADCHGTVSWQTARFDHDTIVDNCFSCHNGSVATGKHPRHIASSNECELCHSTRAWSPAGFDHSNVAPGTCNTCHDGTQATGKPRGHFTTTLSCDECHTTRSWLPADYDHVGSNYPGDHRQNLDCDDCHGGNSAIVTWSAPAYQPDCAGCHANDYEDDEHDGNLSQNRDCGASGCHNVRDRDWD
jgi:hypothetical protein